MGGIWMMAFPSTGPSSLTLKLLTRPHNFSTTWQERVIGYGHRGRVDSCVLAITGQVRRRGYYRHFKKAWMLQTSFLLAALRSISGKARGFMRSARGRWDPMIWSLLDEMLPKCDVLVINMPIFYKTRGMFNNEKISQLKKGVLIVNNARGAIMDAQAVVVASTSGHIAGYNGYIWFSQPIPKYHPWRSMPNHCYDSPYLWDYNRWLDKVCSWNEAYARQTRYAAGTKDMLDRYFMGEDFCSQNYIVKEGKMGSQYL